MLSKMEDNWEVVFERLKSRVRDSDDETRHKARKFAQESCPALFTGSIIPDKHDANTWRYARDYDEIEDSLRELVAPTGGMGYAFWLSTHNDRLESKYLANLVDIAKYEHQASNLVFVVHESARSHLLPPVGSRDALKSGSKIFDPEGESAPDARSIFKHYKFILGADAVRASSWFYVLERHELMIEGNVNEASERINWRDSKWSDLSFNTLTSARPGAVIVAFFRGGDYTLEYMGLNKQIQRGAQVPAMPLYQGYLNKLVSAWQTGHVILTGDSAGMIRWGAHMNYYHLGMTGDIGVNPGFPNFGSDGRFEQVTGTGVSTCAEYEKMKIGGVAGFYGCAGWLGRQDEAPPLGDGKIVVNNTRKNELMKKWDGAINANSRYYYTKADGRPNNAIGEAYVGAGLYPFTIRPHSCLKANSSLMEFVTYNKGRYLDMYNSALGEIGWGPLGSELYSTPAPHFTIADGMGMAFYRVSEGEKLQFQTAFDTDIAPNPADGRGYLLYGLLLACALGLIACLLHRRHHKGKRHANFQQEETELNEHQSDRTK